MPMDDLLREIEVTDIQKEFIKESHEKAGDISFRERAKSILTFYTLAKSKVIAKSIQATTDRLIRTVHDMIESNEKTAKDIIKSNEILSKTNEKYSKKMVWFTAGLFAVSTGLLFIGIVQIIQG